MNARAVYPRPTIEVAGMDGNVFSVIGRVSRALRLVGAPNEEVERFKSEVLNSRDYDHALRICMAWVDFE